MPRRSLLALAVTLLLVSCSGARTADSRTVPTAAGGASVQMTLLRLDGGTLAIESYRGAPVLITLFTTWCLRCQAEAPLIERLYERCASRGLKLIGIALDHLARPGLIKTYADFVGFRFPVLLATPSDLELIGGLGPTPQVPRTVLLDRAGRVVLDQLGRTDFAQLEHAIEPLLLRR